MQAKRLGLTLYAKIALSFSLLILILTLSIGLSLWQTYRTNEVINDIVNQRMPTVQASLELLNGINQSIASLRGWLIIPEESFKKTRLIAWDNKISVSAESLQKLTNISRDPKQIEMFQIVRENIAPLKRSQQEIEDYTLIDRKKALELFIEDRENLVTPIRESLESLIRYENEQMAQQVMLVKESMWLLSVMEWSFLAFGLIIGALFSARLSRGISSPVINITEAAELIAKGELGKDVKVTGSLEIQRLAKSINKMIATMREITSTAKSISDGDYSLSIQPRSEQDKLVFALSNMTKKLIQNKLYYEEQSWLQEGTSQVLVAISQNPELSNLCNEILAAICRYLESGIGALYLFDSDTQQLNLVSSYSYTERELLSNKFLLGHGIVGQVALEKKPILLKNIKRRDLVITTALTEEPPLNTYTFPLIDKRELVGVVELAFHEIITPLKISYLENITPLVSSSIRVCEQKTVTEKLLIQQRNMTKELQVQQEELKASNEELATQAEELRTSEEELRVRDEEQRTLNQSLEERNTRLQAQSEELKRAQADLVEKAKQIQVASKYKSEFLANMSHELRTPLNSLLLLSKMLADNKEQNLNKDQIESLHVIHRSGVDLLQLINDVLDIAKVEAGKIEIHNSKIIIKDFTNIIKADFMAIFQSKKLDFSVEIEQGVVDSIYSDAQRLKQIIKNLISNALKFTENGFVKLLVHKPSSTSQLAMSNIDKERYIAWSLIDTGIGIPKEKHNEVFQTFYQGDGALNRKYNGTGLGLSISAELAKLMGGAIQLESIEGQGSTFTLYLPIVSTQSDEVLNPVESIEIHAKNNLQQKSISEKTSRTLLIIEDDIQFAKILMDVCKKKGFDCKHTTTGHTGLKIALEEKPACILLDINLPDMNGLSVADKLKDNPQTKSIPIHFISGADKQEETMKYGAASYLMKPISIEKLDLAIQSVSHSINDRINKLLVVEDDDVLRAQIQKAYEEKSIQVLSVRTGNEALHLLKIQKFDCMVLDLGLPDVSGFDVISKIMEDSSLAHPAVIIYTGHEITEEEHDLLQKYSKNIIIKGKVSLERLLDETALFLHQMEKSISKGDPFYQDIEDNNGLNNKKILLVDDDMRNTFALAKILKQYGVDVSIASNGKVAIDMLNKENHFDGILMDIMMPVMDGLEAIEKIRQIPKFSSLPIIALTAKAMSSDREKCLALGATDYLTKPVDIDKLIILLKACVCQ
ncbi:response regulator [Candidatus Berkiella cookevillensis]|uniref:histidine kinase n=1 Tax=Candidatus Berkiella cookevillensis TaxID=437022 RepID=A0A0Q9YNR7_9GAMM|nr:response regulator [Candidatus Berkiella cookevillensis]MCS5708832.1 response regulator [Candidatus Berkiella cookevillensis]